jgi:5-enolpyruvylshikimate-3-phosphate synthase
MIDTDRLEITPALRVSGVISVPGDKSISHRLAMIGAITEA